MAVRDLLTSEGLLLTRSEEKIVRLLLAEYPTSGLGTATSLAKRAGVSDPTVVRLVTKLGFAGFSDFQASLMAEVEARLHSPLLMMETKQPGKSDENVVLSYMESIDKAIERSAGATPMQSYDRASRLIMEARGSVVLLGGRFSRHVAAIFAGYLIQFRPGVLDLGALSVQTFDMLADLGRKDVLVVFDYRRYQLDVMAFARQAAARGVRILLFTDQWFSPVAEYAEVTIVSPLDVASPYDTLVPALAQVEALVARILSTLGEDARARIERLEEVRHANAVTLDVEDVDDGTGTRPARRNEK
ncbi:RpiR family transcriptional regulator [Mesorhizobium sp. J18]|uniref:MurR/RpiR family transcriptional regulator n=1 Tax=Mesorhizobium sp. J18 TaxID=935263 RepID=UPI00119C8A74|nr:MurR/RpiR family transcriptional regulator [Mesorhizobium sp. J18]TWG95968.1 RpiR family transcriptional regulator [Mesorhizobium sp. J18]